MDTKLPRWHRENVALAQQGSEQEHTDRRIAYHRPFEVIHVMIMHDKKSKTLIDWLLFQFIWYKPSPSIVFVTFFWCSEFILWVSLMINRFVCLKDYHLYEPMTNEEQITHIPYLTTCLATVFTQNLLSYHTMGHFFYWIQFVLYQKTLCPVIQEARAIVYKSILFLMYSFIQGVSGGDSEGNIEGLVKGTLKGTAKG